MPIPCLGANLAVKREMFSLNSSTDEMMDGRFRSRCVPSQAVTRLIIRADLQLLFGCLRGARTVPVRIPVRR